jgi:autotransporter-associated beta strand protein
VGGTLTNGALTGAVTSTGGTVSGLRGSATVTATGGTTTLSGANNYAGATTVNGGTLIGGTTNAFSATSATAINTSGILDLGGFAQAINAVSLAGGTLQNGLLTGAVTSTGGTINGLGGATTVTTTGGITSVTGSNTYSGATNVNGGKLSVNGSIASSSLTVNTGGTLGGNGMVGNTTINGGALAPGNSIGLLTVQGSLVFTEASSYMVEVSPANADRVNVTGTATLGGATVNAIFAAGTYVARQYTILNATTGVSGTFGAQANTNLPSGFHTTLSYDGNNAFLNLAMDFVPPPGSGLGGNQQRVANAIVGFFNSNGGIPIVFGGLTPTSLTQAAGETAAGSQQTTFSAMTQFLGALLDPFIDGRGDGSAPAGAMPFAEESDGASAYASSGRQRPGSERDAYGMITKAVPRDPVFDPRWSVWATGFGGSQTTDGNATLGSNNTTSRVFGTAVGADYLLSPRTIAGFALAGGGTSFSVANGGSGRSDLFQAGAFIKHKIGAAYISGALAYGWQDVTTDRTVTIAGVDQLRANFNANAFSGRVEGGYRFVSPWMGMGITPYAAGQFTTFDLPAYAESVLAGANTFALGYAAKSVTATRSEMGFRADKSFAMQDAILTLRGRAAWAHDYNTDRNIAATFQALPGASFVVNGAAQASDSALTTASAELKWRNGFSLAATFEGEFSEVTRSYAGKGVARYAW